MSDAAPLGKKADWFYRVEYQQRASPHSHMLIWLEDAPVFGVDDDDEIESFIDKIISCEKPANNSELQDLVNRQCHRHSHTCRKKSKNECRFNYPQPPMRVTKIVKRPFQGFWGLRGHDNKKCSHFCLASKKNI